MPPLVWAAVVAVSAGLALGTHAVVSRSGRTLSIARRNLTRGLYTEVFDAGTLEARRTGAGAVLRTLTPERSARQLRSMLEAAGRPAGLTMFRLLWAKLVLALVAAVFGGTWAVSSSGPVAWIVVAGLVLLCYYVPELAMYGRGQDRQKAIARELPDVLDQMTIAVDAGLGFEAALARAATGKGALAEELKRTLQDVTVGRPRREAYDALVRRTQVVELKRFVHAINQADSYGISISDVLRVQAADMRIRRRLQAEEHAMKIPVKVTFPLMVCILPALMIVVVGPAVLGLGAVLG
jgi:tight adherence protein C